MKARFLPFLVVSSILLALACGLAISAEVAARPAAAYEAAARAHDTEDVVFFSPIRPVLIRLQILADRKSYSAAWDEFLEEMLRFLDRDGDGVVTSREAIRTPSAQVLIGSAFLFGGRTATPMQTVEPPQANEKGQVTIAELRQYYRKSGAPFQVLFQTGRVRAAVQPAPMRNFGQPPNTAAVREALFQLIDTNQDRQLSREELIASLDELLARDADDDEVVTAQEVLTAANLRGGAVAPGPGRAGAGEAISNFLVLTPGKSEEALAAALQKRYGASGADVIKPLTLNQLGLDEISFRQLDGNADGGLDAAELAAFGNRQPDLELVIDGRLASPLAADVPATVVNAPSARLDGGVDAGRLRMAIRPTLTSAVGHATRDGAAVVDFGALTLELRLALGVAPQGTSAVQSRNQYKMFFGFSDQDNNGYLDSNEARSYGTFQSLFEQMDADGDGKIFEKEMLAYLDPIYDLRGKAEKSCATLTVVDQGGGLFDLIDTSGDGRLSVRELRRAETLVEKMDRSRDGVVSQDEIPFRFVGTFVRGTGETVASGPEMPGNSPAPPTSANSAGQLPLWFRKMDRNRDGDVSRREFVGTDEQFSRIDADGDALISGEESTRASQLFRPAGN